MPEVLRQLPRYSELRPLVRFAPDGTRLERRLRRAASVHDLRLLARRRVPRAVFDYADGAADREVSYRRSRELFERVEFRQRVLRDVHDVDTSTDVLGLPSALPVVLAPTGYTRMMHHEGECAVARAAGRWGIPYALSTMGTSTVEEVAAAAPETRRWFQLYVWTDRDASLDLLRRAEEAGCDTLILTVDTPVSGRRLRDTRNGMTLPPTLTARTVLDAATRPAWWVNFLTTPPPEFASLRSWNGTIEELANSLFDDSIDVTALRWVREQWHGTLVVKGVQDVDDVRMCLDAGADAVVVSNHGGRQLDRSSVPLEQIARIREEVGDAAQLFVDGAIMSGSDVAAAVALGADAVLVGRAYLYGLMAGGEAGVDRMLQLFTDELINTMKLLGVSTIGELSNDQVRLR